MTLPRSILPIGVDLQPQAEQLSDCLQPPKAVVHSICVDAPLSPASSVLEEQAQLSGPPAQVKLEPLAEGKPEDANEVACCGTEPAAPC